MMRTMFVGGVFFGLTAASVRPAQEPRQERERATTSEAVCIVFRLFGPG